MGTVTGIIVTGMVGTAIMMGMVGTTIMVMAITGMIGLTVGAMGIAIGMMIAGPGLLTVGVTGRVGIRVTERMPPRDTTIRPTNVSTHGTAGIHAPIIIMAINSRPQRRNELPLATTEGTVYLREGEPAPEGRKAVVVTRVFIDPPEQPLEELPETTEPSPAIERPSPQSFNRPLPDYPLGIV